MEIAVLFVQLLQLSILASVYESFILSDLLSHSGLFKFLWLICKAHLGDLVVWVSVTEL